MAGGALPYKDAKYERVNGDEGVELEGVLQIPRSRRSPYTILLGVTNLILLVALALSLSTGYGNHRCSIDEAIKVTSTYSPVFDRGIDLHMRPQILNGSFRTPKEPSFARQMPNPEADELWKEIELIRMMPITREEVVRMGKDPVTAVKLEDDVWHEGEDKYAATFDVFHQLHCVNTLRQIAYGGYYNKTMADHNLPKGMYQMHVNHCVDMLYQTIACSNNVNLITMHWVETQSIPYPDMSINKMCVDLPELLKWRKEHTIDMDLYIQAGVMSKPEGVAEIPWNDDM